MSRVAQGTWPLLDDPADPWAEPWPDDDLGYADLIGLAGDTTPSEPAYRRAATDLQDHVSALLRGAIPFDGGRLHHLATAVRVRLDRDRVDTRPLVIASARTSAETLCRIALDQDPAAGLFGPDAALGPLAILARAEATRHRRTARYALAHWAAGRPTEPPPIQRWRRANVAPDPQDREAVGAVVRAPLALWRLSALHADGRATLHDQTGLAPHRSPGHPVAIDPIGGFGAPRMGAALLARLVPLPGPTFYAFAPLALPADPDPRFVRATLTVLLARQRLRARRASLEDALRDQAGLFCRLLHEHTFAAGPVDPTAPVAPGSPYPRR